MMAWGRGRRLLSRPRIRGPWLLPRGRARPPTLSGGPGVPSGGWEPGSTNQDHHQNRQEGPVCPQAVLPGASSASWSGRSPDHQDQGQAAGSLRQSRQLLSPSPHPYHRPWPGQANGFLLDCGIRLPSPSCSLSPALKQGVSVPSYWLPTL